VCVCVCVCVCMCICVCVCVRPLYAYAMNTDVRSNRMAELLQRVAVCCCSVFLGSSFDKGFTVEKYIYLYIVSRTEILLLAPARVEERAYNICQAQRSVHFLIIINSDTRIIARDSHSIF